MKLLPPEEDPSNQHILNELLSLTSVAPLKEQRPTVRSPDVNPSVCSSLFHRKAALMMSTLMFMNLCPISGTCGAIQGSRAPVDLFTLSLLASV